MPTFRQFCLNRNSIHDPHPRTWFNAGASSIFKYIALHMSLQVDIGFNILKKVNAIYYFAVIVRHSSFQLSYRF